MAMSQNPGTVPRTPKELGFMDVHPIKHVSIGIDPDPYECAPYNFFWCVTFKKGTSFVATKTSASL